MALLPCVKYKYSAFLIISTFFITHFCLFFKGVRELPSVGCQKKFAKKSSPVYFFLSPLLKTDNVGDFLVIHVGTSAIISGFQFVSTAKKYKGRPSNGFWGLGEWKFPFLNPNSKIKSIMQ